MARTLFIGDVHGCARELKKLLKAVRPTRTILLGDLFTKGPDPRGVWKLIQRHEAEAVMGNHDYALLKNPVHDVPRKALRWLSRRPYLLRGRGWQAVHAGILPHRPKQTTPWQAMNLGRIGDQWWWDLYDRERLVLHGHHAKHGLLDRRPFTLGLDTGCVKSGVLSGYLLEDDEIVGV